jgi:multidrug resistance efflux pump
MHLKMHEKRIPLAWSVRWRRIRSQAIPALTFCCALLATGWLWQWHGAAVQGVGEVDGLRVDITSPTAGLVIALPHETRGQWTVFDHVRAGDIIAKIDDQQFEASKSLLRRDIEDQLGQLNQLKTQEVSVEDATASEAVQRAWEFEQSRLQTLEQLLAAGLQVTPAESADVPPTPPELPTSVPDTIRDEILRARETRRGLDLRWEELSLRSGLLEIPAPISGTLVNVYCWPGQIVAPGGLIATIAADHGQHIVGYVPEQSTIEPKVGMQVTLRARVAHSPRITSTVEEVGKQIQQLPSHQRAIANIPQWGLPVRIKMPSDSSLRPGTLVDIMFQRPTAR